MASNFRASLLFSPPKSVDIPHLRYFVAIVEHQSFSKAAACCHTSVSNISERIQEFERRIGKSLLDRNRRRVVPTQTAGAVFDVTANYRLGVGRVSSKRME